MGRPPLVDTVCWGEDGLRAGPTEGRPRGEGTGAASVSRHRPHRDPENATARASSGGTLGGAGGRHLLACRLVSRRPLARDSEQVRETQEESAAGTWNSALESLSPGPLRPPGGIPEPVCGRGERGWGWRAGGGVYLCRLAAGRCSITPSYVLTPPCAWFCCRTTSKRY